MSWIAEPEEGETIVQTSASNPHATVDINLADANRAKSTYPREVDD